MNSFYTLDSLMEGINTFLVQYDNWDPVYDIGKKQHNNLRNLISDYQRVVQCLRKEKFCADADLVKKSVKMIHCPVFIGGFMKSGTTLLREILDNHPSCVVLPGDGHLLDAFNSMSSSKELYNFLLNYWFYRAIVPSGGGLPAWYFGVNHQFYADYLDYFDYFFNRANTQVERLTATVQALYCANPRRPVNVSRWVEKMPGNEMYADKLFDLYPAAKFVHIVRRPFQNMASVKRMAIKMKWGWDVSGYAFGLKQSMHLALKNLKYFGSIRYYVLKYEDLIENPKSQIQHLADFIGINFHDSLLTPTINGMPAKASSMFQSRKVDGEIGKEWNNQWEEVLSPAEMKIITAIFYPWMKSIRFPWEASIDMYVKSIPEYIKYRTDCVSRRLKNKFKPVVIES